MTVHSGNTKPIRVLVVDDQQLLRRGLTLLLETEGSVKVVAQASHGEEALAALRKQAVDVVLTDARMPVMDGLELARACTHEYAGLPVIVLTTFDDPEVVRGAMESGASGFLLKDSSTEQLVQALRAVLDGGMVIDPRVARLLYGKQAASVQKSADDESLLALLTRTERSVAKLVAAGMTNAEISSELFLAEGTVKNHVSSILRKLGQRDRTALALTLYRHLGG